MIWCGHQECGQQAEFRHHLQVEGLAGQNWPMGLSTAAWIGASDGQASRQQPTTQATPLKGIQPSIAAPRLPVLELSDRLESGLVEPHACTRFHFFRNAGAYGTAIEPASTGDIRAPHEPVGDFHSPS